MQFIPGIRIAACRPAFAHLDEVATGEQGASTGRIRSLGGLAPGLIGFDDLALRIDDRHLLVQRIEHGRMQVLGLLSARLGVAEHGKIERMDDAFARGVREVRARDNGHVAPVGQLQCHLRSTESGERVAFGSVEIWQRLIEREYRAAHEQRRGVNLRIGSGESQKCAVRFQDRRTFAPERHRHDVMVEDGLKASVGGLELALRVPPLFHQHDDQRQGAREQRVERGEPERVPVAIRTERDGACEQRGGACEHHAKAIVP